MALAAVSALAPAASSLGAEGPAVRLLLPPVAPMPADGRYLADDQLKFMISQKDDQIRLRFTGSDEVFYLTSEPAPLGGRVLKYDTGEVALQVAGWGGLTLYTEAERGGVPAERADDADDFEPKPVAARDLKTFAARLAQELATKHQFPIEFTAHWDELAQGEGMRALAVDAMRNAAYALQHLADGPDKAAIAERVHTVRAEAAAEPGVKIDDGMLVISYTPEGGPSARPSSLAIIRAIDEAL